MPEAVEARAPVASAGAAAPGSAEAMLRRIEWTALRRLDGLLQGDFRTLMRGNGIDLSDLRLYQPYDDVRHIDWNVTARMQEPHVRVFSEDRDMAAWFVLDLSPSLDVGPPGQRKRDLLERFVALVASLLVRYGSRIGAVLYDGQALAPAEGPGDAAHPDVIPPRTGRRHLLHLLHSLQRRMPVVGASDTDLAALLLAAVRQVRSRSTVFVVSDFISRPGWDRPLAALAQRHDVVAVRLVDAADRDLPAVGLLPMQDAETGELLWVDTHDAGFRRRFAALAQQREALLMQGMQRAGVDAMELSTADDMVDALVAFVDGRQRRVRGRRVASGAPA